MLLTSSPFKNSSSSFGVDSGTRRTSRTASNPIAADLLKRVADAGPVVDRALLAGGDRDHQLVPAGIAQRRHPLPQLLLGRGEGGTADQLGGHEALLLGLHEDEMAAVV